MLHTGAYNAVTAVSQVTSAASGERSSQLFVP